MMQQWLGDLCSRAPQDSCPFVRLSTTLSLSHFLPLQRFVNVYIVNYVGCVGLPCLVIEATLDWQQRLQPSRRAAQQQYQAVPGSTRQYKAVHTRTFPRYVMRPVIACTSPST